MDDEVCDRLLSELRQKDEFIKQIKQALYASNRDLEQLSVAGAIKKILLDLKTAELEIEKLKKDIYQLTHSEKVM